MQVSFYNFPRNYTEKAAHFTVYSPITFNQEWPKSWPVSLMALFTFFGAAMNGYFVSSFFVESSLSRLGNVFQGCMGLADTFITCGAFPIVFSAILSGGEWDCLSVCRLIHFLVESSTYCYSLFFSLIAIENYLRICRTPEEYDCLHKSHVCVLSIAVFLVGITLAIVGVFLRMDYDYCTRSHYGDPIYRLVTFVVFHGVPCVVTVTCLTVSMCVKRINNNNNQFYKRFKILVTDSIKASLNLAAYVIYVAFWIPFVVVSILFPGASDAIFYYTAWVGVARSLVTSSFYGLACQILRRTYGQLFNYCICKLSLRPRLAPRHRRSFGVQLRELRPPADVRVRVHVLQCATCSPHRRSAAAAVSDVHEL